MAELSEDKPDFITDFLFIQERVVTEFGENFEKSRGFKKDYLNRNLNELENKVVTCPNCEGIMRRAVVSKGVISCGDCCSSAILHAMDPVDQIRNPIATLEVKCPLLRDCLWIGKLCEAETHLVVCGRFKIFCPNECGTVIKRCENIIHMEKDCPLRGVTCQYCNLEFTYELLECHLSICSIRPIKCDCGDEFPRVKLAKHIGTECPLAKVECPYAKYSCKIGSMQRKDILAHKKEFYIEHQDMLEEESNRMKNKIRSFQIKVNLKRSIEFVEWIVPDILSQDTEGPEGPNIYINNFKFKCCRSGTNPLNIGIRKFQSGRTTDRIIRYQLRLSSANNQEEPYTLEATVDNTDVGNTMYTLFALGKDIYTDYIQEDNSIILKIFYCTTNAIISEPNTYICVNTILV